VRILTLNRPDHLNSVSDELHDALRHVWHLLEDDEEAGAVVITGAGRAFSAGGDIPMLLDSHNNPPRNRRRIRGGDRLAQSIIACELPVIAAVNGPAVGLGCSLAVMSDLVVMNEDTYMADPHVSVGVVAGDGGTVVWPLMMSLMKAKEYLLLGERIQAKDCERLGLANRVVARDQVLPVALELAERLAAQPVQALRDTKRALNLHLQAAANVVLPFAFAAEETTFLLPPVRETAERFLEKAKKA
jgi:enoyl-CoA hydratase